MKFASKFYELAASRNPVSLLSKVLLKFSDLNLPLEFRLLKFERSKFRLETRALKFYGSNSPLKPRGERDVVCRRAHPIVSRTEAA
ncbi:hypothetical protein [uncultured Campylobacter sp.]|uniref:hypothetical protein n=1 Tax=uncultured Campylobacter sp. TaxID=218934 RepID=UPI0026024DB9|nr:hypothetical protein [uncultured Campylobacter sp.]